MGDLGLLATVAFLTACGVPLHPIKAAAGRRCRGAVRAMELTRIASDRPPPSAREVQPGPWASRVAR